MTTIKCLIVLAIQLFAFATASVSTYSKSFCATRLTTKKPASVPTSTRAYTLTFKPKVTTLITNTYTVTPSSTTVTDVATSTSSTTTTVTQVTDTFTSTLTQTISDTTTTTLVSMETDYSTVLTTSYGTYTVPASAGFTPLASVLSASDNTATKKRRRGEKLRSRVAEAEAAPNVADLEERGNSGAGFIGGPKRYPAAVTCTKLVQIVSTSTVKLTAKKTATVTAPQGTVTQTSTTVLTTTVTSIPVDASSTVTVPTTTHIIETTTVSSTTTITLATTSTVFAPVATFYAACDTNNLVSAINGKVITDGYAGNGFSQVSGFVDAYSCCVACIQSDTCAVSLFFDTYFGNPLKYCLFVGNGGTCSGSTQVGSLTVTADTGAAFVASNGNCGRYSGDLATQPPGSEG